MTRRCGGEGVLPGDFSVRYGTAAHRVVVTAGREAGERHRDVGTPVDADAQLAAVPARIVRLETVAVSEAEGQRPSRGHGEGRAGQLRGTRSGGAAVLI